MKTISATDTTKVTFPSFQTTVRAPCSSSARPRTMTDSNKPVRNNNSASLLRSSNDTPFPTFVRKRDSRTTSSTPPGRTPAGIPTICTAPGTTTSSFSTPFIRSMMPSTRSSHTSSSTASGLFVRITSSASKAERSLTCAVGNRITFTPAV